MLNTAENGGEKEETVLWWVLAVRGSQGGTMSEWSTWWSVSWGDTSSGSWHRRLVLPLAERRVSPVRRTQGVKPPKHSLPNFSENLLNIHIFKRTIPLLADGNPRPSGTILSLFFFKMFLPNRCFDPCLFFFEPPDRSVTWRASFRQEHTEVYEIAHR